MPAGMPAKHGSNQEVDPVLTASFLHRLAQAHCCTCREADRVRCYEGFIPELFACEESHTMSGGETLDLLRSWVPDS